MNTLLFDTCFGACSAATTWVTPKGVGRAARFERMARGHAERLMPMLSEVMEDAPFGFADLQRIVVTAGPGTFTGQRVGIAAARALSLSTGAPIASLSSLEAMAYTAAAELGAEVENKVLAIAVDARRGEIYFQAFAVAPEWRALDVPALVTAGTAVERLAGLDAIAVGSGAEMLAAAARDKAAAIPALLPALEGDVAFVPEAAIKISATPPRPLYLRPPDAKPQDGMALERV